MPNVKRLILKSVPEGTTRLAMLKTGEADIAVALDGPEASRSKRDPRLQLVASRHASIFWIEFADQWDPKSPWHDKRLRQAVNFALDRKTIERGGLPRLLSAGRRHRAARDGLRAAGASRRRTIRRRPSSCSPRPAIPNGLDAGDFVPIPGFSTVAEAAVNYLNAVGIRVRMRPMERAAFYAAWREKKLHGLFMTAVGNSGNAASRVDRVHLAPRARTPTAATRTSTTCSSSRPASATSEARGAAASASSS